MTDILPPIGGGQRLRLRWTLQEKGGLMFYWFIK